MNKTVLLVTLAVLLVLAGSFAMHVAMRGGFTARRPPSALEAALAKKVRRMAIPSEAKTRKNPFAPSPALLSEARRHFADHCAVCHANNGSGDVTVSMHLYPKAPDMRLAETQDLTDGELYYIIQNGIAMSGMPAWGEESGDHDADSWKLVLFLRHLSKLTPAEIEDMKNFNPQSAAERNEEQQDNDFLTGAAPAASGHQH
jgi:mono/diheme cytochrome c family protein